MNVVITSDHVLPAHGRRLISKIREIKSKFQHEITKL